MARKFLAALLVAFFSLGSSAATVADRSPFTQGLWWDVSRSGNGFDIFSVGNDVSVLWYTYDSAGMPIWYSAQGPLNGSSTATLSLMEHRWTDGKHASATAVGTLKLDVRNAERIVATWALGMTQGSWTLTPFSVSGVINEVDHTGTWFDPRNAGWGLSFMEQGDVTGGIVFLYDAAGHPTWLAGFGRDRNSVEMFTYTGTCPSCAYSSSMSRSVGRLAYDFDQEWQMTLHNAMTASMAAGIAIEGTRVYQLSRAASGRAVDRQLAAFASDASLKDYLVTGYANIYNGAAAGFSAAPPAIAFSTTNLQEAGVDEADLVKTDGQFIYTYASDSGVRRPVIRIAQVANDGSAIAIRGSYALASGSSTPVQNAGLYLNGSVLASVTGASPMMVGIAPPIGWFCTGCFSGGTTNIEVMSLSAPDAPSTRWRAEIDGRLVSSRRLGDRMYVVLRFVPQLGLAPQALPVSELLPKIRIDGGPPVPLLEPSMVYSPPQGERAVVADLIVVVAIDLTQPRVAQALGIVGTPDTVYASPENLYVATTRSAYRALNGTVLTIEPGFVTTDIHQIKIDTGGMTIVGSGTVEGYLGGDADKSAFRMGEYSRQLRVVSSSQAMWGRDAKNRLTVLEPSKVAPGLLRTVSFIPNTLRPDTLGKPGELLYATRFVTDRLYAVTFKKIDPLYVVDVSNGNDPKIAGSVELPGFSDYLHPLTNGLLLGFGKDACPATQLGDGQFAWYQGLQLALFDVSDANHPKQLQQLTMGKRGSTSALLTSHHAFSALTQPDGSTTIGIPGRIHDGTAISNACDSTTYAWKESGLMRFDVRSAGSSMQLTQMPSLITHTPATTSSMTPFIDPAADGGRSILFRGGTVYVGGGQFWRQDASGNTSGPF